MEKSAFHDVSVAATYLRQAVQRHTNSSDPVIRVELSHDDFRHLEDAMKMSPDEALQMFPHKGTPGKMLMNGVQFVSADLRRERLIS